MLSREWAYLAQSVGAGGRLCHLGVATELLPLVNGRLWLVHRLGLLLHVGVLGCQHALLLEALRLHLLHHLLGDDLLLGRGALQILELLIVLIVFVDLGQ